MTLVTGGGCLRSVIYITSGLFHVTFLPLWVSHTPEDTSNDACCLCRSSPIKRSK